MITKNLINRLSHTLHGVDDAKIHLHSFQSELRIIFKDIMTRYCTFSTSHTTTIQTHPELDFKVRLTKERSER